MNTRERKIRKLHSELVETGNRTWFWRDFLKTPNLLRIIMDKKKYGP